MALTEIQLKRCRFHDFLSQKGSRPLAYSIAIVPPGADHHAPP